MSFPEIPLLVFPSLARRIGVEESLLYYICQQLLERSLDENRQQTSVPKEQWLVITDIWDSHQLASLQASLLAKGVLKIESSQSQIVISKIVENTPVDTVALIESPQVQVQKTHLDNVNTVVQPVAEVAAKRISQSKLLQGDNRHEPSSSPVDAMQILPVYDVPPAPPSRPLPIRRTPLQQSVQPNTGEILKGIGPAPSFGGYKRLRNAHDPFKKLLDDKEQQNKKLFAMTMDWKPSDLLFGTLARNNIPRDVAMSVLDEFRLYYCDKNNKERSWDQKFLAWVKNSWVKKQSADNRAINTPNQAGSKHENSQRDTREKRKRISAAIMDIHDTNW